MIRALIALQAATAIYLQFFRADAVFAPIIVLIHIIAGLLVPMIYFTRPQGERKIPRHLGNVFSAVLLTGILLMVSGTVGWGQAVLALHILFAFAFIGLLVYYTTEGSMGNQLKQVVIMTAGSLILLAVAGQLEWSAEIGKPLKADFFPSPGNTKSGSYLAAETINRSQRCGASGCHPDIYEQWSQSAHRNSSFTNPFYAAAVEYLLSTSDSTTVRWCGSCHDPVMLYSGLMVGAPNADLPEAQAGITCETCHGIVDIPDITGNANYILDRPVEYPFSHQDGLLGVVNRMLIRAKPDAHREGMLRPIHKAEDFCATCHKVSLDVEINQYKWLRGQDEYDAWQASGVSYNAVASFYNPPKPLQCQSCHMVREISKDKGNDFNKVFGHFFPAANTALPVLPKSANEQWLDRTSAFLQDGRIGVDIFGAVVNGKLIAPLGDKLAVKPGQEIRFQVVVRTKKIGHVFPGGTADSNEPWLEVTGVDEDNNLLLSSGTLTADQHVDPSAHFFRGVLLDGHGEFILKRNPHEWRTTLYNNSIPPGSADIVHYTWKVPDNFAGEITMTANLNYRKFNRSITVHSLDDPIDLPIITMAEDHISLTNSHETELAENAGMRYNDYGIGMLRQKNLEASRMAFEEVTRLLPEYADGFVNVARVLIKEGKFEAAESYLEKALALKPGFSKAKYFQALIAKMSGDYERSIALFQAVRLTNPNDRVMLKHFGQTQYFAENWAEAKLIYNDVLRIDPEDSDAHYNLMLINRKLGDIRQAKYHSEKYLKYKPDEQARSITQIARLKFPHANNEAQLVHSHELNALP